MLFHSTKSTPVWYTISNMKSATQKNQQKPSMLKRFVAYYKPYKGTFALDMLCSFIYSISGLLYPIATRQILDNYIPEGLLKEMLVMCAVLLGVYVLRALLKYYINYYGHVMGVKMQADMRSNLFAHLEKLPYSFYDNHETGQLMTRMTNDLFDVSELAHHGPENLFITSFITVGSFVYLCTINWKLSLIIFAFLPILVIISWVTRKDMNRAFEKSREEVGNINATLESSLSGIRTTKAYSNEQYEQKKFENDNSNFVKARSKAYKAMGTFHASMSFVTEIYNVIVLVAGGLFCMFDSQNFDYVDLVSFMISINLFISPVQTLIQFFEQVQDGTTGFKRYLAIIDIPCEQDSPTARDIDRPKGDIRFENVTFEYEKDREVLKDVNLQIPAGKTYALVGASGGGKTTLCHLIPKFYKLEKGVIYIDGEPISEISNKSLRQSIGIVQQDVFLFTGSFRENIAYGKIGASDEEIVEAAKHANIHEYISSLPNAYDTQIGEKGIKLSGGQKQRMSIARLFLKNPAILILDEATSALDNATESLIQHELFELCKGRTTIIVAHRLSTVRNADKIVVVNKGKIEEQGTHEQLIEKDGIYKALYDAQYQDGENILGLIDCN